MRGDIEIYRKMCYNKAKRAIIGVDIEQYPIYIIAKYRFEIHSRMFPEFSILFGGLMKSVSIPWSESDHLISYTRTEDVLVGPLCELYFYMSYAGHYVCRRTYSISRGGLGSHLLLLTLAGEGKLRYQGKEYRLPAGSVILIDGRNPHEYHALEEGWTFKYLHFQGALSDAYQSYVQTRFGPVFQPERSVRLEVEERLDEILLRTEAAGTPDYAAVSSCIYTILTAFLSRRNTAEDPRSRSAPAIQQAVAYIAEHYRQNISTQDIADAVYLSRSYMSELFTKTYGMAPHEYLTMYRLTRVKDCLLRTSASLSEIAEQTGFRDIFTLSRVFKQKFGLSPSEYRKNPSER